MATSLDLAKLIDQIPSTDPEIEAREKAARLAAQPKPDSAQSTPAVPATPPPPGPQTGKFTGPAPALADQLCKELAQAGPSVWMELIEAIRDPAASNFDNFKAEYLFHCLSLYLARPANTEIRSSFTKTMAAQIQNRALPVYARLFLVRELHGVGGKESIAALVALLEEDELFEEAARILVAMGNEAASGLRGALREDAPARRKLVLLHGLARLRDADSVPAFRRGLKDPNIDVRLASAWALARLADVQSIDSMLKAADVQLVWERVQITDALLLMAENFVQKGQPQVAVKIYAHLEQTRTNPDEEYLRRLSTEAIRKLRVTS